MCHAQGQVTKLRFECKCSDHQVSDEPWLFCVSIKPMTTW